MATFNEFAKAVKDYYESGEKAKREREARERLREAVEKGFERLQQLKAHNGKKKL